MPREPVAVTFDRPVRVEDRGDQPVVIVKLKRKSARHADLSVGQPYVVIGIEADDRRILNNAGRPFLYPARLFAHVDDQEPRDWVTEYGAEGERYSYPRPLSKPGF